MVDIIIRWKKGHWNCWLSVIHYIRFDGLVAENEVPEQKKGREL